MIHGVFSGVNAVVQVDGVEPPEYDVFSGEVLYIEQRKPIIRADEQSEIIQIIVEF